MADISDYIKYLQGGQQTAGQSLAQFAPYLGYAQNLNQYTQPGNDIAAAMGDTNSPMYKRLYGQFRDQGKNNLVESIAEVARQNRKLAANGRVPLFDNERGGEQMFRALNQGYQDVQGNASKEAFGQLNNAYQANAIQGQLRQKNALQQTNVYGGITGALAKLFGL